jgi:hypothetical protein
LPLPLFRSPQSKRPNLPERSDRVAHTGINRIQRQNSVSAGIAFRRNCRTTSRGHFRSGDFLSSDDVA